MDWKRGLLLTKDPNSVLDYVWDYGSWLSNGDTITAHDVTAQAGITVDASTSDTTKVTVWLSGGTAGETYEVTVRITTSQNRVIDRTVRFGVSEQ